MTRILYQIRNKIQELEAEINMSNSEALITKSEHTELYNLINALKRALTEMEYD